MFALTKPKAQQLRKMEYGLRDYENERLGFYKERIDEMHLCYDAAKRRREMLKQRYDAQTAEHFRLLQEINDETSVYVTDLLKKVKAYAEHFEIEIEKGTKEWKSLWKAETKKIDVRLGAIDEKYTQLDLDLKQEGVECLAEIKEKKAVVVLQLEEQRVRLQEQTEVRKAANENWIEQFRARFADLKQRLRDETETRIENLQAERVEARIRYNSLNQAQRNDNARTTERLQKIQESIKEERVERTSAQEKVVSNMMVFMAELEGNISNNVQKQKEAQELLLKLSETPVMED